MIDLRILIVDDEPLARDNLRLMLENRPACRVIGEAANATAAWRWLENHRVDVVFLDIQMPGINGIDLASTLSGPARPLIIFVTAYEEFALAAFGVSAADYLLKPYDEARLALALERAAERHAERLSHAALSAVDGVVEDLRTNGSAAQLVSAGEDGPNGPSDRRLIVRDGRRVFYIPYREILWFETSRNYLRVHTAQRSHLLRQPLRELEQILDPALFIRVHRRAVVNLDHVAEVRAGFRGDYRIRMTSGASVTLSRRRRDAIAQLMARHRP